MPILTLWYSAIVVLSSDSTSTMLHAKSNTADKADGGSFRQISVKSNIFQTPGKLKIPLSQRQHLNYHYRYSLGFGFRLKINK